MNVLTFMFTLDKSKSILSVRLCVFDPSLVTTPSPQTNWIRL